MTLIAGRFEVRERNPEKKLVGGASSILEYSDAPFVGLNLNDGTYGVRVGPEVGEVKLCVQERRNPQKTVRAFNLDTVSETPDGGIILSGEVKIRRGANYGISIDGSDIVYADPHAEEVRYFQAGRGKQLDLISVAAPKTPFDFSGKRLPVDDLRIYEAHVKGLTASHPGLPKWQRGTLAGLEKVAPHHLVDIGMNAIELLPIAAYNPRNSYAVKRGLTDYWGYNPDAPSAVHPFYSATGQPKAELQSASRALHKEGIALILDLVYNHAGVDSRSGIGAALKALNKQAYHPKTSREDNGFSGVGESPNLGNPMILNLVLDSVRHWISLGVDGIRFDLATALMRDVNGHVTMDHPFIKAMNEDPILKDRVMIAEPWDLGPYGYQVGNIGRQPGWKEWDDKPHAEIDYFWKGEGNARQSEYNARGRDNPRGKISYVSAHDGFTVRQKVTYLKKNNAKNKQKNENGNNDHFWNSGYEGPTENMEIRQLRRRRMMSMYLDLALTNTDIMVRADDMQAKDPDNDRWSLDEPNSWNDWSEDDPDAKLVVDFRSAVMKWREQSGYFGTAANTNHDRNGRPIGARIETSYNVWGQIMADHEKGTKVIGQGLSDSFHRRGTFVAYKNGSHSDLVGSRAISLPDDGEYRVIFNTAEKTGMPTAPTIVTGRIGIPALAAILIEKVR